MITLHAQPYDLDASGFYFQNFEEYESKASANKNRYGQPVEEYEIQLIDGASYPCAPDQSALDDWLDNAEQFENLTDDQKAAFEWLVNDLRKSAEDAFCIAEDVYIFNGALSDYAYDFVTECYELPEIALQYFDYDSFALDMRESGDVVELSDNVWVINPNDF